MRIGCLVAMVGMFLLSLCTRGFAAEGDVGQKVDPEKAKGAVAWAGQDEHIPLALSIAVPVRDKQRSIGNDLFHVVVRNISTHPVNLWRGGCSWGYYNLTFVVTEESGKSWIVKKKHINFKQNFPDFCTIDPNGDLVIDVTLKPETPETWENPPRHEGGKSRTVTLQAIFQIEETEESKKFEVWTGKVISEAKQYIF